MQFIFISIRATLQISAYPMILRWFNWNSEWTWRGITSELHASRRMMTYLVTLIIATSVAGDIPKVNLYLTVLHSARKTWVTLMSNDLIERNKEKKESLLFFYFVGTGDNDILRHLRVLITSSTTCNSSWDGVITDNQVCVGHGDSGACRVGNYASLTAMT